MLNRKIKNKLFFAIFLSHFFSTIFSMEITSLERSKQDWLRDFKHVYGVDNPKDLPSQDTSDIKLTVDNFTETDFKEIQSHAEDYGVRIQGNSVNLGALSPLQAAQLSEHILFFNAPSKLLLQAVRLGDAQAAWPAYQLAHKLLDKYALHKASSPEALRAALWCEYAALNGEEKHACLFFYDGCIDKNLPLNIALPWVKKKLDQNPEQLFTIIIDLIAGRCITPHKEVLGQLKKLYSELNPIAQISRTSYVNAKLRDLIEQGSMKLASTLATILPTDRISYPLDLANFHFNQKDFSTAAQYYVSLMQHATSPDDWPDGCYCQKIHWFTPIRKNVKYLLTRNELTQDQQQNLKDLLTGPYAEAEMMRVYNGCILKFLHDKQNDPTRFYYFLSQQEKIAKLSGLTDEQQEELHQLLTGPFSPECMQNDLADYCLNFLRSAQNDPEEKLNSFCRYEAYCNLLLHKATSISSERRAELKLLLTGPFSDTTLNQDHKTVYSDNWKKSKRN